MRQYYKTFRLNFQSYKLTFLLNLRRKIYGENSSLNFSLIFSFSVIR